jgi:hypothetical protein
MVAHLLKQEGKNLCREGRPIGEGADYHRAERHPPIGPGRVHLKSTSVALHSSSCCHLAPRWQPGCRLSSSNVKACHSCQCADKCPKISWPAWI